MVNERRRYLRRREYPHPPPPSTSNTSRTIKSVLSMACLTSEGQRNASAVRRHSTDTTTASPSCWASHVSALSFALHRCSKCTGISLWLNPPHERSFTRS